MTRTTPIDTIIQGDCLEEMKKLPDRSIDAIVTDPPYELAFMGKKWDASGIAYNVNMWGECLRVLKPGGHLLAFGGTRTYHRMACAIEDAGFEIRDSIHWVYGCLSPDTEIMINGKWERYHKANIGDLTICYNNETDSYSWQPIQEVFEYRIKDTAYRIQSDLTDQIVTRNHRCLIEREGKLLFCLAEEAAKGNQIRVPILESLRNLQCDISLQEPLSGSAKQNLLQNVQCPDDKQGEDREAGWINSPKNNGELCGLRETDIAPGEGTCADQSKCLLLSLQRDSSGRGVEEARTQRPGGLDARERSELFREDERVEKSGMERRCNLLQNARQLSGREICPMPSGISINGPERRLCDGAPFDSCTCNKAMPEEVRGCTSYQPRPDRQPLRESSAIQYQPGPQEIRGAGITQTTLARIEPIDYDGLVWCVRVPTGAFIARRNGKIFVTGNSGFPKSLDISKALDKMAGAEREVIGFGTNGMGRMNQNNAKAGYRPNPYSDGIDGVPITTPSTPAAKQWTGFGSALKPAHEPVVLARKPLDGCTIAENVLRWGTGGLNIDGCRVSIPANDKPSYDFNNNGLSRMKRPEGDKLGQFDGGWKIDKTPRENNLGRFPANLIHDNSPAVLAEFAKAGERSSGGYPPAGKIRSQNVAFGKPNERGVQKFTSSSGSASRFFMACEFTPADYAPIVYYAKASKSDRGEGNTHNTVKPTSLIQYLCKLITPPGGLILDPFGGSGTTGMAAMKEGFHYILIEKEPEYCEIARKRIAAMPARLDRWAEAEG